MDKYGRREVIDNDWLIHEVSCRHCDDVFWVLLSLFSVTSYLLIIWLQN